MRRLTVTRIEGLAPEAARYELTDHAVAGLQLRVEPTGGKSWILRYYWRSKRVRLSLGTFPGMLECYSNRFVDCGPRNPRQATHRSSRENRLAASRQRVPH